ASFRRRARCAERNPTVLPRVAAQGKAARCAYPTVSFERPSPVVAVAVEAVLLQQREVVALVEDLDLAVRVQLAQSPDLLVLLRDELLVHRRHFDVGVELRQEEVRRELLDDLALLVPLDVERPRLVLPFDLVEVEQARVLAFALVREVDAVALQAVAGRDAGPALVPARLSRCALRWCRWVLSSLARPRGTRAHDLAALRIPSLP